ncbi:hypothetical protein, partial [Nocardioides sp. J9]|uniref:hypothetical protein n=1 Tax=Nocardioides sp. J9 TaxID=935844 RepID=UPI001C98C451
MKRLLIPSAASALALLAAITPTAPGLAAPPPGDGDLDLDPPTIAITPDQPLVDGWSTGAVTLAVKLTDVGSSGVGGGRWTLTGATSRSGSIVATSASIQVENPGRTTLTVEAWDRDGNEAERQLEVGVDTAAPTITLGPNLAALDGGSVDPGTTTVDYSCADAGSGVASCTGDLPVGAALDTGTTRSFTIVATDRVGRTTERTLSWQVKDQPWHVPTQPTFSPAGDIHVGDTLTADPLEITPTPDEVHYQWYRDGAPIPGATGASYTTTVEDAGAEVRYIAIPSKPGYAPRAGFASDW